MTLDINMVKYYMRGYRNKTKRKYWAKKEGKGRGERIERKKEIKGERREMKKERKGERIEMKKEKREKEKKWRMK